jgi:transcriptional regulator with XRE-family HTH domain
MDSFENKVGQLINIARKKTGLSQADLAKAVGLTRTSISNLEHGNQGISLSQFYKIAYALHYEPSQLLMMMDNNEYLRLTSDEVPDDSVRFEIDKVIKVSINKEVNRNEQN